jgi:hypothetical protein
MGLKIFLKDPFRAAEMAIEIQVERMRVVEAITARDAVVQRLADAHISIREKVAIIGRLELEKEELERRLSVSKGPCDEEHEEEKTKASLEIDRLQGIITSLREDVRLLKEIRTGARKPLTDPPPRYEEGKADSVKVQLLLLPSAVFYTIDRSFCIFHRCHKRSKLILTRKRQQRDLISVKLHSEFSARIRQAHPTVHLCKQTMRFRSNIKVYRRTLFPLEMNSKIKYSISFAFI